MPNDLSQATTLATPSPTAHAAGPLPARATAALALAALGIVFGDLGTSPLYALQAAFQGPQAVAVSPDNVVGVVSLFVWSLVLMVSLKYVFVLMQADNHGEGGILALLALLIGDRRKGPPGRRTRNWIYLAMIGTAMLYGDGVITPAISVLSAVEGLEVATPAFVPYVVPITVVILVLLFAVQPLGSGRVGVAFGPILAIWFVVIFILGLASLVQTPAILAALNPLEGLRFFAHTGWRGFVALGAVVLCLTGGEALYADMGHFGPRPIRLAWYLLALPALTLNYLGQGALLLRDPAAAARPFYSTVPAWGLYPMVALATLATIVAAQALISAVFSLTRQAAQLGINPRVETVHTSASTAGQIYLPGLNWTLMAATVAVVLYFRSSDSLAAAFGLAVSTTMAITTVLFAAFARSRRHWPRWRVGLVAGTFLTVDLAFVGANTLKFADGGWLPVAIGTITFLIGFAWFNGQRQLRECRGGSGLTIRMFISSLALAPPQRVQGMAVFMMPPGDNVPKVLLHHLKHNQVLHERVVLLSVITDQAPRVEPAERLSIERMDIGFLRIIARCGYMEQPNVPALLEQAAATSDCPHYDPMTTSFYLGRETLALSRHGSLAHRLLLRLFIILHHNELDATSHFGLPPNRVVELGARLDLDEIGTAA